MRHATEGELHAFADGALSSVDPAGAERLSAHLDACADCRALLERARTLRDESAALLEAALGAPVEAPPFEALVERAAEGRASQIGSGGRGSGRALRIERLAWAASLVLALGAGWMGHAVLRQSGGPVLASRPGLGSGVDALEPAGAADPAAAEVQNAPIASRLEEVVVTELPTTAGVPEATGLRARADAAGAERENEALQERVAEPSAAAERRLDVVARDENVGRVAAGPPPVEGRIVLEQAAAADAPAAPGRQAEVAKAAAYVGDFRAGFFSDDLVAGLVWRAVERDSAAAAAGGAIPSVPELEVLDYAVASYEGGVALRVRQRLPGGEPIELVSLGSAGADPDEADVRERPVESRDRLEPGPPDAEPADRQAASSGVWIMVNGRSVRVTAPVAPDSLAAILSRIR